MDSKKICTVLFSIMIITVFGSLLDINYASSRSDVTVILSFATTPRVNFYGINQSLTVHYFSISNTAKSVAYVPVSAGPVEAVHVVPIDGTSHVFVYCITPVTATYNVSGTKLYIRFPRSFSTKRITANFSGVKSEIFLKEVSDYFGIDMFLYDGAKGKSLNIKLTNASLEEVLRSFTTISGLSFAYGYGKVLYVGTSEEITKNFVSTLQLPEGKLENLKKVIGAASNVRDKSKVFIYGGVREYKMIADSMVTEKQDRWVYVKYPAEATEDEIDELIKKVSEGLGIKYLIIPTTKQVALSGPKEDVDKVASIVSSYKPKVTRGTLALLSSLNVNYPNRVAAALKKLIPNIQVEIQGNLLFVPKEYEEVARKLSLDSSIGNPYRVSFDASYEDSVHAAAKVLGVHDEDIIVSKVGAAIEVALFGSQELFKNFVTLVDSLKRRAGTAISKAATSGEPTAVKEEEERITIIFRSSPNDPPVDVLSKMLGYQVEDVQGYLMITVPRSQVESVQERFEKLRSEYERKIILTDDKYQSTAKELAKKLYDVDFHEIDERLLIIGINALEAKKFLDSIAQLPDQVVIKTSRIDEKLAEMLSKMFKIEIFQTANSAYIIGTKSSVELARQYVEDRKFEVVSLSIKFSDELVDYIKKVYSIEAEFFPELGVMLLGGTIEQVQNAKKFLESLKVDAEISYIDLGETLKENDVVNLAKLFNLRVEVKQIGPGVYVHGERSAVTKLKSEVEALKKLIDAKKPVITSDYSFLIYPEELDRIVHEIFEGVKTFRLGPGYVVYGTADQIKSVENFVSEFSSYVEGLESRPGEITFESTIVTLETTLEQKQVEEIVSLFGEKVKVTKIGKKLYLAGKRDSVLKVRDEISKYKPDTEYVMVSGNLLIDVKQKQLQQLILEVSKLLGEEVVVIGSFDSTISLRLIVRSFSEFLAHLNSYGVRYDKIGTVYRVYGVPEKLSSDSLVTVLEGEVLNVFVKNQSLMDVIYGTAQILKKSVVFEKFEDVKVTLSLVDVTFEELLQSAEAYGIEFEKRGNIYYVRKSETITNEKSSTVLPATINMVKGDFVDVNNGKITLYFSEKNVDEIIKQVLGKLGKSFKIYPIEDKVHSIFLADVDYDTFKTVFSEWVEFREENGIVYVLPLPKKIPEPREKETKVVQVSNGKITINAEYHDLSEIIKDVFRSFGYSVVFSKPVDKKATMAVSEVDFETFKSIVLNYGVSLKQSGSLYFVDITPEATKVINTYTFNVVRGADKVKELIEFYGGKATVNSDAGIVIAYNLDPRNVDDIRRLVDKISRAKLVSIEARVVDTSLLDSIGIDLGFYLNSQDALQISSRDGLKLSLKVLELFDFENLWKKILDNAQIGINATTGQAGSVQTTQGSTKLLASPNVVAKSGESARIFIGDSIPIVLRDAQTGQLSLQYLEAGIELRIVPMVNPDDSIELDLYTAVGNFDFTTQVGGYPRTSKREATTKLTLKDGQTLVIGGLAREEKSQQTWKVPILGDLPIIGMLFRGTRESLETRNIVIFLTAKIIEQ